MDSWILVDYSTIHVKRFYKSYSHAADIFHADLDKQCTFLNPQPSLLLMSKEDLLWIFNLFDGEVKTCNKNTLLRTSLWITHGSAAK